MGVGGSAYKAYPVKPCLLLEFRKGAVPTVKSRDEEKVASYYSADVQDVKTLASLAH